MPNYELDRIGHTEFERLIQSLLKEVIGPGTTTFGDGPDGAREATFVGEAGYPSQQSKWKGHWIFQAKYHDTRQLGPDKARRQIVADLQRELQKITDRNYPCDNFILATNVPLTSVAQTGTHDKISKEIISRFRTTIPNIHIWGYDDLCRFLDSSESVRKAFLSFITPGDLIAELMEKGKRQKSQLAEAFLLYVRTSFDREQYAQLDQAGEIGEKPTQLRRVFVDLNVKARTEGDFPSTAMLIRQAGFREALAQNDSFSALAVLLVPRLQRTVLIGGPGQGKSTLGQFIAQIHRASILNRLSDLGDSTPYLPETIRLPFRVILKDFAQWVVETPDGPPHSLERFLSISIEERAGRTVTGEQLHETIRENPTLFIFDGLDEVVDLDLRTQVLSLLSEFIDRCEDVLRADLQVIATSRPTGYSDQFDPSRFLHLILIGMGRKQVSAYTERWIVAKGLESGKAGTLRGSIQDCLADPHFASLMNTPLQVTIFILIILTGGSPPRQREELFNEYLEVIYKRERAKSKTIIQTEKRLLLGLHQYLGYLLQKRAGESSDTLSRMKEEEFTREVVTYLRHEDPYSSNDDLHRKAEQMITEARRRLVLLVEFEDRSFGFELRSLQEFFAAGWLTDRAAGNDSRFERFRAIAIPFHWRNVALFFAGRVGRSFPGEAAAILEACREIDRHPPDHLLRRGASLALELAIDRSFGPNRILQRSAIEFALTFAIAHPARTRLREFLVRLSRLPDEDIEKHVRPLLREMLSGLLLPEGMSVVEAAQSLKVEQRTIEAGLDGARSRRRVPSEQLLRKLLALKFSSEYIRRTFKRSLNSMSLDTLVDCLGPIFAEDPRYAAAVLEEVSIAGEVMAKLFFLSVTLAPLSRRLGILSPAIPEPLGASGKVSWDVALAWTIVESLGLDGRVPEGFHLVPTTAETTSGQLRGFSGTPSAETVKLSDRLLTLLEGGPTRESITPELEASALAVLWRLLSIEEALAPSVTERLSLLMPRIGQAVRELAATAMFHLGEASARFRHGHWSSRREYLRMRRTAGKRGEAAKAYVTWPLRISLASAISSSDETSPIDISETLSEAGLPIEVVLVQLENVRERLRHDRDDWRAWAALSRLGEVDWLRRSWIKRTRPLELALLSLIEILREEPRPVGRWELVDVISRAAPLLKDSRGLDETLRFLGEMDDGPKILRRRARHLESCSKETVELFIEMLVEGADEARIRGVLKVIAFVLPAARELAADTSRLEIRARLSRDRLAEMARSLRGVAREGALIILANSRGMSLAESVGLLKEVGPERGERLQPWVGLLRAGGFEEEQGDAGSLYEEVARGPFGDLLREAALELYQQLFRSIPVGEQEGRLGLPL